MLKTVVLAGMAAAAFVAMSARGDEPAAGQAPDAKTTFEAKCATCHGKDGKGAKMGEKVGVRDYSDAKVQATLKDDEMIKAIKEGLKKDDATTMKAFGDKLSDAEIKALVDYVKTLKAK